MRRGYTLVELLVAAGLGGLLLTAVFAAFIGTNRLLSWTDTRTDVDNAAMQGLNALAVELRSSAYATVTIISAPPALCFLQQDSSTSSFNGFSPVRTFTIYYYDVGLQSMVRKVYTPAQPPTPLTRVDPGLLPRLCTFDPNTCSRIAKNVTSMSLTPVTFPVAVPPRSPPITYTPSGGVQINLSVQATTPNGQVCSQTVTTSVVPRNHP